MRLPLVIVLSCLAGAQLGARTVAANYRNDFNPSGPPTTGWNYLWNAPAGWSVGVTGDQASGFIGVPTEYRPLNLVESAYYADTDTIGGNNAPSGFLRLTATGGHPGLAAGTVNKRPRHAIAAYTVQVGGLYAIENSSLSVSNSASDGVEVLVFPGRSEAVLRRTATFAQAANFDVEIGYLDAGQTIYVAIGPGATATSDGFLMDFSIVRYDRQSFRDQLLNGIASGSSTITIAPGRYYANPTGAYVTVNNLNRANHVTIIADGVELINQSTNRTLAITNSSNLTLRGLMIDYNPQLYRQGTVEAINNNTFQLRLHEGYPQTLTASATSGIVYESGNLRMKQLTDTFYPTGVSQVEPGLFTITTSSRISNLAVGDHASLTEPAGIPHAIYLETCTGLRMEGVKIHGSPAFALLSREGYQITLDGMQVVPGATPLRAIVPRLLSSSADGLHFKSSFGEITITNCRLAYNGDDSIILTGAYCPIIEKPQGNVLTVATKARQELLRVGDVLNVYNPLTGRREVVTIQAVTRSPLTGTEIRSRIASIFPSVRLTTSTFEQAYILTLSSPVTAQPGGWLANRAGDSSGFVVSHCTIENTRARGILIKASNGVVRNNYIFNTILPGIQVRPESEIWMEGDFAENVSIEDNELRRCAIGRNNGNAPINVTATGFENWTPGSGHLNIAIVRNRIFNAPSVSIFVQYADNVTLRSNRFTTSHNFFSSVSPFFTSAIQVQDSNAVQVTGLNLASGINTTNANLSALVGAAGRVTELNVRSPILHDSDQDSLPDAWEQQYFGNLTTAGASHDADGDGRTAFFEFLAGLNPLAADEIAVQFETTPQPRVRWTPISNRFITLYATESLASPFTAIARDIPGEQGYHDVPALPPGGRIFYRIGVTD